MNTKINNHHDHLKMLKLLIQQLKTEFLSSQKIKNPRILLELMFAFR